MDEGGLFIPILSGHVGGANALAEIRDQWMHRAVPVITTATDVNGFLQWMYSRLPMDWP